MPDLTPSGQMIDERSKRLQVRKKELALLELKASKLRNEIQLQELQDRVDTQRQALEEVTRKVKEAEQELEVARNG